MRGTMSRVLARGLAAAALCVSAFTAAAHTQYLDPGSSSILIQVLLGGIVGLAAIVKLYWNKIRGVLSWSRKSPRD